MAVNVNDETTTTERSGGLSDNLKTILYALLIALLIRIFLFQPFNIPSGSMKPSLLVGDYLFVSKFEYGFSRHSFPFSPPLFDGRFFASLPKRGDVAVFKLPRDGRTDYIKRVIGLPGDRIQVTNSVLYINGEPVERQLVRGGLSPTGDSEIDGEPIYRETLPNGVSYLTVDKTPNGRGDNTDVFIVPPGHYFMMGDNRDNSTDSRFDVGYVPLENFVGEAKFLFFSTDYSARWWEIWKWPMATRWNRIFLTVD